jgi:hypothetical protein
MAERIDLEALRERMDTDDVTVSDMAQVVTELERIRADLAAAEERASIEHAVRRATEAQRQALKAAVTGMHEAGSKAIEEQMHVLTEVYEVRDALRTRAETAERELSRLIDGLNGPMVYENVVECTKMLDAAGMGAPGKPNTLWAMVKEIIADRDAAQGRERTYREHVERLAQRLHDELGHPDSLFGTSTFQKCRADVCRQVTATLSQPVQPNARDERVSELARQIAYMFWNHSTSSFSWEPIDELCAMYGYSLAWTPEGRAALSHQLTTPDPVVYKTQTTEPDPRDAVVNAAVAWVQADEAIEHDWIGNGGTRRKIELLEAERDARQVVHNAVAALQPESGRGEERGNG